MKVLSKVLLAVLCLSLMFLMLGAASAKSQTMVDSVLQIPKTSEAPVIDGVLDKGVWYNVTETKMNVFPEDWIDHYTTCRVMYDDNYFYFFGHAMDSEISTNSTNSYENDSWELFFDNQNLKTNGPYVSGNDIQWRWVYGETALRAGWADVGEWAWVETDYGYDFELKISADTLSQLISFDLEEGHEFGFEVQNNERDAGTRQTMSKWWDNTNEAWHNPSYFGNAVLAEREVSSVLDIWKVPDGAAPAIDGVMDDAWKTIPEVSMNTYVENPDLTTFSGKEDLQFSYRAMWDEAAFYFFGQVIDDEIHTDGSNSYENDSFELFLDNQNLKTNGPYVAGNDIQCRWVYGETALRAGWADVGEWKWVETDYGYDIELKIPADTLSALISFDLEEGHEFGFEVQVNDREAGTRETMGKWWDATNEAWHNPSYFGTAELVGVGGRTGVAPSPGANMVKSFRLAQNYPNPFNPTTSIDYSINSKGMVNLTVYNLLGHEVATLVNEVKSLGNYTVLFDASNLPSGIYFYQLKAGSEVTTQKMTLLK